LTGSNSLRADVDALGGPERIEPTMRGEYDGTKRLIRAFFGRTYASHRRRSLKRCPCGSTKMNGCG